VTSAWLHRFEARPDAAVRLFCFPSAGTGAATYRPWASLMPRHVEVCAVQLPGRENRLREPAFTSLTAMLEALRGALRPQIDRPFAFFGHSMGALVAFELARALQSDRAAAPAHLLLSGRRPPHIPEAEAPLHALPDDEFIASINRRYGGIPDEILRERDLLALLLPGLRADMTLIETHRFEPGALLDCPLTAFGGSADTRAAREQLDQWRLHTRGPARVRMFDGGHFYLHDDIRRRALIDDVALALAPTAR
jgi:medium-chain acyl-[acyl-carrier-protein] hydrolase